MLLQKNCTALTLVFQLVIKSYCLVIISIMLHWCSSVTSLHWNSSVLSLCQRALKLFWQFVAAQLPIMTHLFGSFFIYLWLPHSIAQRQSLLECSATVIFFCARAIHSLILSVVFFSPTNCCTYSTIVKAPIYIIIGYSDVFKPYKEIHHSWSTKKKLEFEVST